MSGIKPFAPLKKVGTSITPKVAGDTLDATPVGSVTPAAGAFTTGSFAGLLSQIGLGESTYLGFEAGKVDDLTNNHNTGIGYQALLHVTNGGENTAVGYLALKANTTGGYNTAIGFQALLTNTTGNRNTALGYESLKANTTGVDNIALGWGALYENTIGEYNIGIGVESLFYNTTGNYNIGIGDGALNSNTTGNNNTALGLAALRANETGLRNIAIGYYAGKYEIGNDKFYVNNQDRTDTAGDKAKSIIYGQMAAAVVDQKLTFNANVTMAGGQSVPKIDAGAASYNPSILTSDYIITVNTTAAARAVTISTEDRDSGSATSPRIFIIKDIAGNAGTNNITVSLETTGNIDGAATAVINTNYDSITLMVDGTNGFVI